MSDYKKQSIYLIFQKSKGNQEERKENSIPSPSLSKRQKASLNSAICSSVNCSAIWSQLRFMAKCGESWRKKSIKYRCPLRVKNQKSFNCLNLIFKSYSQSNPTAGTEHASDHSLQLRNTRGYLGPTKEGVRVWYALGCGSWNTWPWPSSDVICLSRAIQPLSVHYNNFQSNKHLFFFFFFW